MNRVLCCLLLSLGVVLVQEAAGQRIRREVLKSPDGGIVFNLYFRDRQLSYLITYKGKKVIDPSALGLMVDGRKFGEGGSLGDVKRFSANETYPWRGVHNKAVNFYNAARIQIDGTPRLGTLVLEVRVFNEGVAFRYIISNKKPGMVGDDNTEFVIPEGSTIWSQPSITDYEGEYQCQKIDAVPEGQRVGPPLTIQLPGETGFAAITEGGLTDFAGMSLIAHGSRTFKAVLADSSYLQQGMETPWRIIEIGSDLNTLVNCDIIHNVSPAFDKQLFPKGFNTDWIQPGKAAWSWLAGNGRVTVENMKRFSRWAGELGFAYNLVDSGWWRWHEDNKDQWDLLKELVRYSYSQHVKIWVWKNYQDRNGIPGLKHPDVRHEVFEKCKEAGVVGLKIDYLSSETPEVIRFYKDALAEAARLHLMIDFHGAAKPVGLMRAFPNEMSREAIRGLEYGSIPGKTTDWPVHNTTLPFTRFLAGHADYTPLSFRANIQGTTWAHQVASSVIFTSAFMCLAVDPEFALTNPCVEMIKSIPVIWDRTIVLPQSRIGQLALFARKKGDTWYLAAMNGDAARSVKVSLSFLGPGKYHASYLEDMSSRADTVRVLHSIATASDSLTVNLNRGGGFVGNFEKQ